MGRSAQRPTAARRDLAGLLLVSLLIASSLMWARSNSAAEARSGRRYGPTAPGGYYVWVTPSFITMPHSRPQRLQVSVEDAAGQPVDDLLVHFAPSEGTITTEASRTRGGTVTGTFSASTGSDDPRTAFVTITVEDIEVTVFIDIVPAVFGR